uniref:NADH dehydrogenase subunit 3 n=1 Tax=Penicillidia dufourii TaxID=1321409 RepID=UPI002551DB50|nr:NADH dehydrogenase subunit 3 [Penicillidia dufourii]WGH14994.1 NADH dehydrogenase subunit 3 [Penicillidia dufourii]
MFLIMLMSIMFYVFSMLIMMISFIMSMKTNMDREKSSPFECGFDPKSSSRIPFSLHFFLITVMFLIFDVEITLILPMILTFKISNLLNWSMLSILFLIILLIGLYHEWNQGMLNWL